MSALNTPLHYESQQRHPDGRAPYIAHLVIDAGDVQVCEVATREEAEEIVAAVNREAEHPETVRKLLDILRGLLRWHDGGEPAEWTQQQSVDDLHKHLAAARAPIAAAEGGA